MGTIGAISEIKLKKIIKEAVHDAVAEEIVKLRLVLAPYISEEEQAEIERLYKSPERKFVREIRLK